MQAFPTYICVKVDFKTAFGEIECAAMIAAFAQHGTLDDMHRFLEAHLRHAHAFTASRVESWFLPSMAAGKVGSREAFKAPGGFCVAAVALFPIKHSQRKVVTRGRRATTSLSASLRCWCGAH